MKWTIVLESDDVFELGNVSGAKAHEDGKFIEIRLLSKRKESVVILDTRSIRFFEVVKNTPLWLEDKPYVVGTAIGGDMQLLKALDTAKANGFFKERRFK